MALVVEPNYKTFARDWRETFLRHCGPGLLGGITLGQWFTLLRTPELSLDASRLPRALAITLQSLKNAFWAAIELRKYGPLLKDVVIQPPLFILGHWRSGTTYLHQLLAQDRRFSFPNLYQTSFPHTFLSTEKREARMVSFFLPRRRPMDNVEW